MREYMQEHPPFVLEPASRARHQRAPNRHMLEHLDRNDAVKPARGHEFVHIGGDDLQIGEAAFGRARLI